MVAPEAASEDLTGNWIIETNDAEVGEPARWNPAWETWFIEDDAEADRIEKEHAERGEKFYMKPRSFIILLELLKKLRPDRKEWEDYRFVNADTGMIVLAWVLK